MSTEHRPAILFERHGSWRQLPYLLFTLFFGGVGILCLVGTIRGVLGRGFALADLRGLVIAAVILTLFLGIAFFLSYRMVFSPNWFTRIDEQGITMSRRHWPWNNVKRVFTKATGNSFGGMARVSLNFHNRSGIPLDYGIQGFESLSHHEAEEILDALEAYLEKEYPEIDIE